MSEEKKYVYFFGWEGETNLTEGSKELKPTLGGKGANVAEMTNLGLPVPPGFTLSAEAQDHWVAENDQRVIIERQVAENLAKLERVYGEGLGDMMLVSVRSGAAVSMPGMMDTVLNLGLNDANIEKMVAKFDGNERFCWDSYRRFVQMFGNIAMGIDIEHFEEVLAEVRGSEGVEFDKDLSVDALKTLVARYKVVYKRETLKDFPDDPKEQMNVAITAVFGSWMNPRAVAYRRINKIHDCIGTAVTVQVMVYGNMNDQSGTGVAFTRNPADGENKIFGEFLVNAQGEDVVAGLRTPIPVAQMETTFPECYEFLVKCCTKLESHYKHIQDMEFTIQDGKFWFLQTRNGKMTIAAQCQILLDMVEEGMLTRRDAVKQLLVHKIDHFLHPTFDPASLREAKSLGKGIAASPGAAVGVVVFNNDQAVEMQEAGTDSILCRVNTSPEDLIGMNAAVGILTSTGGRTSHAAVVARGMGKCCVCGFGGAKVSEEAETVTIGEVVFRKGDTISIDGTNGDVYAGAMKTHPPELPDTFKTLLEWEKEFRKMMVWANADTPKDAQNAIDFGCQGIGLTRTEHMFFATERIAVMREMILADRDKKAEPLSRLKPFQRNDFVGIFRTMKGLPVTIRMLDPPLHEFLPKKHQVEEIADIAKQLGVTEDAVLLKIDELHEENPMLGHRGCRLGITFPDITIMQAEAIYEAAYQVVEEGIPVKVDIMIPLINSNAEYLHQKDLVKGVYDRMHAEKPEVAVNCTIGTMIETPRAAIRAATIAEGADFFSFGTNDLTQMTLGFSRDDSKFFVDDYIEKGLLRHSPFQVLDQDGVGWLVRHTVVESRKVKPEIKIGICGEHGGEPSSVAFCFRTGLDYVSCSPFRILTARIAAAQASIAKAEAEEAEAEGQE